MGQATYVISQVYAVGTQKAYGTEYRKQSEARKSF